MDTHIIRTPFHNRTVRLGALVLSQDHLAVIVLTVVLCAVLFVFFRHTKLGVAMQATSQNQLAAYYVGIPVKRVFSLIWAISAAVAAFAGILLAPIAFVHANMGFIGIKAFPAAVLGGFGSVPGAIVGGLIIGVVEALAGAADLRKVPSHRSRSSFDNRADAITSRGRRSALTSALPTRRSGSSAASARG